jgi:proteic killer suppression protein
LEFSFSSNRLHRQLETKAAMDKAFGERAGRLRLRLGVLEEAQSLADVPTGPPERCHPLKHDRKGQFAVTVCGNWRIIFRPHHDPLPVLADQSLDLTAVTAIEIIEVVDYHGK